MSIAFSCQGLASWPLLSQELIRCCVRSLRLQLGASERACNRVPHTWAQGSSRPCQLHARAGLASFTFVLASTSWDCRAVTTLPIAARVAATSCCPQCTAAHSGQAWNRFAASCNFAGALPLLWSHSAEHLRWAGVHDHALEGVQPKHHAALPGAHQAKSVPSASSRLRRACGNSRFCPACHAWTPPCKQPSLSQANTSVQHSS